LGWCWGGEQHPDQGAQKPVEPTQEQTEVVAGSGEHGVDPIAVAAFELPPDNGSRYIVGDLAKWLAGRKIKDLRGGAPYHLQPRITGK